MRSFFLPLLLVAAKAFTQPGPPVFDPTPPDGVAEPRHTTTHADPDRGIAQEPGLREVKVDSVVAGNVWVRISGRVLLTGGCASMMPLYSVEMRTDTGWVERIPFNALQLDCGMPRMDWTDHAVMIPVAAWVRLNSREGQGELEPGNYRLIFTGANMEHSATAPFRMD